MTTAMTQTSDSTTGEIPHYPLFIGGEWVETGETYEVRSPATEEVVATVAKATTHHVDLAVAAAQAAHEGGTWRNTRPADRADLLERVVAALFGEMDRLTRLGSLETGQPLRLSQALSVGFPLQHIQHFADLLRKYEWERPAPVSGLMLHAGYIRREPIGVCGGIVPWNFPLVIGVWKAIPAIAAGNTVVLKTDEKTPVGAMELARILSDVGLPPGVLNIIPGDGSLGAHLVAHPDVRHISFTGSTATGRSVMKNAADNVKKLTLELGGKSPSIVLDDADLDLAVDGTIWGFLMHAGQACESGTRLLLPNSIHDEFVSRLLERIATLKIGNPLDPSTDIGPVMSAVQRDRILGYIASGKEQGATLLCGGKSPEGPEFAKGHWVEPTVFTDVNNSMRIACEEIFGPVLSIIRYETLEEAIKIANDTEYGLAAGVWSTDVPRAMEVANQLEAGSVFINDWHNISQHLPFGGYKQSGNGREVGPDALDEYTEIKAVSIDLSGGLERRAYGLVLSTPPGTQA